MKKLSTRIKTLAVATLAVAGIVAATQTASAGEFHSDLTIRASASNAVVTPGATVTYTVKIGNEGTAPGYVNVNAALPTGFTIKSVVGGPYLSCQPYMFQNGASCTSGNKVLGVGQEMTITIKATAGNQAGTFSATVDPANIEKEFNEANNSASVNTGIWTGTFPFPPVVVDPHPPVVVLGR